MAETIGCECCGSPFDPDDNINPDSPYCSMDCYNEVYVTFEIVDLPKSSATTAKSMPLKDKSAFLQTIKEKIGMAKKARMRIVQMLLCDSCDEVILRPEDGLIVHGNIYVADPSCRGGLIGNNFPEEEDATVDRVTQQVFCNECFKKALKIAPKPRKLTRPRKPVSNRQDDIPF